jgi:SOS-response transcriptional repressor LexA
MTSRKETTNNKRTKILSFIRSHITAYQLAPTLDEIAAGTRIPKTTVNYHMILMEMDGVIRRPRVNSKAVGRVIEITSKGKAYLNVR